MNKLLALLPFVLLFTTTVNAKTRDGNPRIWQLNKHFPKIYTRYIVEYKLCLLTCEDTLQANDLSNALNKISDGAPQHNIPKLTSSLKKTKKLILRYHSNSKNIQYSFDPEPIKALADPQKNELHLSFSASNKIGHIPYITVRAEIEPGVYINPYENLKNPMFYCKETTKWPVGSKYIYNILKTNHINTTNELTKLESIMHWLRFKSGIKIGVEPKGKRATRNGVIYTINQKHGNCWDYSDLLVSLCRTLKLPCRQVAGWQNEGGGHIWAEVYLTNIGWIQINPTTGKTIDSNYIPLFTTSDGKMSLVYRSFPKITLKAEQDVATDADKRRR